MYILKNAWTSIVRNKGRNIFIGIIILVIACAISVTLAIRNSASSLIEAYENSVDLEVTLGMDRSSMMGNFDMSDDSSRESMSEAYQSASQISVEDIESYGDSEYVKSYYYTLSIGLDSDDIEAATSSFGGGDDSTGMGGGRGGDTDVVDSTVTSSDFTIQGYSSYEAMTDFISGSYSIVDGEVSSDFDSMDCVINQELAELNSLSVGDTITFVDSTTSKEYTFTITGIYTESDSSTSTNMMSMFSNSVNTIITNTNAVSSIVADDEDLSVTTNPTFVLVSQDVLEAFEAELREKGLSEYLSLTTNESEVESATSTISNVSSFATTFLIITLIIGAVVLLIINMINIRERKYEIGVLRTIGMKKSLLTLQFISELLIVAIISLIVGAGIGALISVPVSNSLLESEVSSSETQSTQISENFGRDMSDTTSGGTPGDSSSGTETKGGSFGGTVSIQAYDSIDAAVDLKVLLQLMGIGIALTLLSASVSMISIQKFSPLTILKERS